MLLKSLILFLKSKLLTVKLKFSRSWKTFFVFQKKKKNYGWILLIYYILKPFDLSKRLF